MIHALSKNDLLDENGKLDIYAFMRSAEIREYMRKNESFDLHDKIYIILKSMNPFEIKLEAMRALSGEDALKQKERRHILSVIKYTERILQEIYSPTYPAIIAAKECYSADTEGENAYEASVRERNNEEYYASYEEFLQEKSRYIPEEGEQFPRYEIDLVYQGRKHDDNNPIHFSATWMDDRIEIYAIEVDYRWGREHYYAKNTVAGYFWLDWMRRYSLPFPTMSRVQIQTPFMKEPLAGRLESNVEGRGCWYHFFYPDDERGMAGIFMDFSYHGLDIRGDMAVFDWVSSETETKKDVKKG